MNATSLVAVAALVFAMTGGAYAAKKYLITSTKQISPSVLKALQGKAGAAGANGAPGAGGAQGPAGPAGNAGSNGSNGTSVTSKVVKPGEAACNKEGGAEFTSASGKTFACNGTTGFTAKLPKGETETGAWTDEVPFGGKGPGFGSISFAIPLTAGLDNKHVFFIEPFAPAPKQCPGTVAEPAAEPGNLCVYAQTLAELIAPPEGEGVIHDPSSPEGTAITGAGRTGAFLDLFPEGTEGGSAWGTWAVTAP